MAIAFATTPTLSQSGTAAVTTSSFTPPNNSLLVVCVASGGTSRTVSITNSAGLTFTQRAGKSDSASSSLYIHTAPVVTGASMTVTATYNTGSSASIKVWAVTGVDLASPVGATFAGSTASTTSWSPTLYTSTVAGSMMIGSFATFSGTPSSTDVYEAGTSVVAHLSIHKASPTPASGTVVSTNISSTVSGTMAGVAVEILRGGTDVAITAIASAEAFGTAKLNLNASPTGIASQEAWGTPFLEYNQTLSLSGVTSGESFGTARLNLTTSPVGIASRETWGTQFVGNGIGPTGIASEEAWGTPTVARQELISPTSINTLEAWGTPELTIGYPQSLSLSGMESLERFGFNTTARLRHRVVFKPPTIQETPMARNVLHIRYGIHRGISVIKRHDGTFYETRYPAQTEMEETAKTYLGGHVHPLTNDEANELTDAGYGANISLELAE